MSEDVYVVGAGEYSDYHVLAVFTDLERAKAYARRQKENEDVWSDTVYVDVAPLNPRTRSGTSLTWDTDDDAPPPPPPPPPATGGKLMVNISPHTVYFSVGSCAAPPLPRDPTKPQT